MKPPPWTHSNLDRFKNCEHQFVEVKVYKRFPDDFNDGGWGDWVHKQIPAHFEKAQPWHQNILPYVPQIEAAVKWAGEGERFFEKKLAIGTNLQACDFFAPRVWGRGIADLLVLHRELRRARAIDWKTGKMKTDNEQLIRFSLLIFQSYPDIDSIDVSFEWLHSVHPRFPTTYKREQLPELWRTQLPILTQYKDAFQSETFRKRQSGLCNGWCPVTTCEYWRPKK